MSAASIEDLTRQYQAELSRLARQQFTNAALRQDWLDYTIPRLAEQSRQAWKTSSARLIEWADGAGIHVLNVQRKDAAAFIAWVLKGEYEGRRGEGPLSAPHALNIISGASLFYDYLKDVRGLLHANPFASLIAAFKKDHREELKSELRGLDPEEGYQILLGAEGLDDFLLGLLLVKTGVRRTECATIRMERIDWQERSITLESHRKRTHNKVLFDEETEYFLRLKCEKNKRLFPGNPYLWADKGGKHVPTETLALWWRRMIQNSSVGRAIKNWKDPMQKITLHTGRRAFTSWLKSNGCPSHVVARLRGDSLRSRSELVADPTQGIYTKFGKKGGVDELRYWYDKCMPKLGAREAWDELTPSVATASSVAALFRAARVPTE